MVQLTLEHVSKHLTVDILDKVFKLMTNNQDDIKNVKVTRAAPAGEGLISAVYRIHINGSKHKKTCIAKGLVNDTLLRKSLDCQKFFKREAMFFSEILPALVEVQTSLGAKERIQEYLPICYSLHIDGEDDYILMEDISQRKAVPLKVFPSKLEKIMTLKTLAHFHAVSMALREKNIDVFEKITKVLDDVYYNENNRDWYAKYLQGALEIDKNVVIQFENVDSVYYKKIVHLLEDDIYSKLILLANTGGDNPVINHGDAWFPNFLCSKDKVIAIDFQLVRCASPATDLCYFLILCSNSCKSKEDFFESVLVYHSYLKYYLEDMGLDANKILSLEVLKDEIIKYGKFGILAALTSFPLIASERHDNLQSNIVESSGNDRIPLEKLWVLTPMNSDDSKKSLINAIRIAVDVGLI